MKPLTPAERKEALKSFVDPLDDGLEVLDRSTIETWGTCPWQAKAIEDGRCKAVGILAEAGEVVHEAFSDVTKAWIESAGAMSLSDLRMDAEFAIRNCRPDLQPEAMAASKSALWTWAKLINSVHPHNIIAFDGGDDINKSGQLAIDFPDLGTRATSELDLLYSSESQEVLEEVDYKTGWAVHEVGSIAASFQFQLHALLIFENFPGVECVNMRVFDTRPNQLSYRVQFKKERQHDYAVRIRKAIETRKRFFNNPPTWPVREKCAICDAAAICPVADEPMADLASDPPGFVKKLIAVEARADAMREMAAKWVDANKQDIQCGDVWFGRRKPASTRKPVATIYELTSKE